MTTCMGFNINTRLIVAPPLRVSVIRGNYCTVGSFNSPCGHPRPRSSPTLPSTIYVNFHHVKCPGYYRGFMVTRFLQLNQSGRPALGAEEPARGPQGRVHPSRSHLGNFRLMVNPVPSFVLRSALRFGLDSHPLKGIRE
jgi:hypothetical protein